MNHQEENNPINRREFLNLAWLASLGFVLADVGGVTLLFAYPRLKEGAFGTQIVLGPAEKVLPPPGSGPLNNSDGRFWLSRVEDGSIVALYKVCTHLGCLYNWQSQEHRFICPCHGSEFQLDGTKMKTGPAPRSLDRFVVRLLDESGREVAVTDEEGNALPIPDENLQIVVDTRQRVRGKRAGEPYPTSEREEKS